MSPHAHSVRCPRGAQCAASRAWPLAPGRDAARQQRLLEALVAILIFSFGVLGIIGILAASIRATNDARYRAEAANLANAVIGDMWATAATDLDPQFGTGGPKLVAWQNVVARELPSAVRRQCADRRPRAARAVDAKPQRRRDGVLAAAGRDRAPPGADHGADRKEHMSAAAARCGSRAGSAGIGLIEIMVGILISMLMVLIIYQVYLVSEGQKRTITAGSDAQQNASYGLFLIGQDLMGAGQVISASTTALAGCAMLRPIPAIITAGATDNDPDTITVLYGGSSSLSTPAPLLNAASVGTSPPGAYLVAGPLGFSPNDVIVAVQGTNCTLSIINAAGVSVAAPTGIATISHTLTATPGNNTTATYGAVAASLVNLGQAAAPARRRDSGRPSTRSIPARNTLRTQSLLPTVQPATPAVSNVVNLKAQFGLDTNNDGTVDVWQPATGNWSAANLPLQPQATWQQIRAVRIAIVTRSDQYEIDPVTPGPLEMFCSTMPCAVAMTLDTDAQHYRYKVLETTIPFRNALWNAP